MIAGFAHEYTDSQAGGSRPSLAQPGRWKVALPSPSSTNSATSSRKASMKASPKPCVGLAAKSRPCRR